MVKHAEDALALWLEDRHVEDAGDLAPTLAASGVEEGPDAAQTFRTRLAAAGVSIREEAGPACQRGDDNLARLDLG